MRRVPFKSEAELAARVVAWLKDSAWTVYQEVQTKHSGHRADIVAVRAGVAWVIETKNSFSSNVVDQAYAWMPMASRVSIAVPYRRGPYCLESFCAQSGIGILNVSRDAVYERQQPKNQADDAPILRYLKEEHKTFASAGNATGSFFSPFKATCLALTAYVATHPGTPLLEAVKNIQHHYSTKYTAVHSLRQWLDQGKISGVRLSLVQNGDRFTPLLYPQETEKSV